MTCYTYTHHKAARWAIGSSGVVFADSRRFEVSVWSECFSGEAGVESGGAGHMRSGTKASVIRV